LSIFLPDESLSSHLLSVLSDIPDETDPRAFIPWLKNEILPSLETTEAR